MDESPLVLPTHRSPLSQTNGAAPYSSLRTPDEARAQLDAEEYRVRPATPPRPEGSWGYQIRPVFHFLFNM